MNIKWQITLLPIIAVAGAMGLLWYSSGVNDTILDEVVFTEFEDQYLGQSKTMLKALVTAEAITLGEELEKCDTAEEKFVTTVTHTDPIRFFDDGTGYFFVFDMKGITVNIPTLEGEKKSGLDRIDVADDKGNFYVRDFIDAVKKDGGGFVSYYFRKFADGKDIGLKPKMSYVTAVPNSDYLIGCGVYIDSVQDKIASLKNDVDQEASSYAFAKYMGMFTFFLLVGAFSYVVIYRVTKALRAKDHWYNQLLATSRTPLMTTDMDMNVTYLNPAAEKAVQAMSGKTLVELEGKPCATAWCTDMCGTADCPLQRLKDSGTKETQAVIDGTHFDIDSDYIYDEAGKRIAMFELLNDVSDREQIKTVVDRATQISMQAKSGSTQINTSAQTLSKGATDQASSLEEITSSMYEMNSQTEMNANNAKETQKLAAAAKNAGEAGNQRMTQLVDEMSEINDSAQEITKVIKVIDDIAFQTNLLALNAAVEAARAGQHGKGFAVVAEEVRNLAARSAKAAGETGTLIEGVVQKIEGGNDMARSTAEVLTEIVEHAGSVVQLADDVAVASTEQAQGVAQVNQGLQQIDQVTQANAASAEETASAAMQLDRLVMQLTELVSTTGSSDGAGHASSIAHEELVLN